MAICYNFMSDAVAGASGPFRGIMFLFSAISALEPHFACKKWTKWPTIQYK